MIYGNINRKFYILIISIVLVNANLIVSLNNSYLEKASTSNYYIELNKNESESRLNDNGFDRKSSIEEEAIEGPFEFMIPENPTVNSPRPKITSRVPIEPQQRKTTGIIKIAVLLIYFNGGSYGSSHTPSFYWNLIFNHNNPKSVASYYWENSYGQLNLTGEIVGNQWFQSANNATYWGEDLGTVFPNVDNKNDKIYNLVAEGVTLADPSVNFTRFDTDKDAILDHLIVIHAGNAQESASGNPIDIWSHRWSVTPTLTVDSVAVKDYTMCAETSPMGTFAHELGHDIGDLPDLYDTDYSSDGIGTWGIMAAGSWNYNSTTGSGENAGDTPAHFCAWSKIKMGWITPTILIENKSLITIPSIESTPQESVLKIYLSNETHSAPLKEYYLICYRQQTGFDAFIPGSGLLIWHIDECVDGANDWEGRKLVDLEEADGNTDIIPWEQLDYRNNPPPIGATIPDDNGNALDVWSSGSTFNEFSIPSSHSNDKIPTDITIDVHSSNIVNVTIADDPLPWDYTLNLMDRSAINMIDDEPSLIEHAPTKWGMSQDFTVIWQSNRTGALDIYGSQTTDTGKTWSNATRITSNASNDYSPSLILWYPPAYWVFAYGVDKENKPIVSTSLRTKVQPPPSYIVAFVSNRTGNPEIFLTRSHNFIKWTKPIQITSNLAYDLDPCLITNPDGEIGMFWASNRTGNYELYYNKAPWNSTTIIRITNNLSNERHPSYYYSHNNTHLLVFEQETSGLSSIHLLSTLDLTNWPTSSMRCTDALTNSTEPSLFEREDSTLLITFTHPYKTNEIGEEIHQIISSDWVHWSVHLKMAFPKNASSSSLVEANCGALFLAYASYNASQLSHIYLIHSTQCFRYGVGIKYPYDTGYSFFNPSKAEIDSDWVFVGYLHLNETHMSKSTPAENYLIIDVNDTQNTWDPNDDVPLLYNESINPGEFPIFLNPDLGTGNFTIPINHPRFAGLLPTDRILAFRIKWEYTNIFEERTNVNSTIYIQLLAPQEHIQFSANVPEQTTEINPLNIQAPIINGTVQYGVESLTLDFYDTTDDSLYHQQTLVFTEFTKAKDEWVAFLPDLKDNTITKIIATSNGIYPRKESTLFIDKSPWDINPPKLVHISPTGDQIEGLTVIFSEQITDDQGIYNYGINESSITFNYLNGYQQGSWISISYTVSHTAWIKTGNLFNFTLILDDELIFPLDIEYYWSACDLANPGNCGFDGTNDNPYTITVNFEQEPTTSSTTTSDGTQSTTTTTKTPIGFGYLVLISSLICIIVIMRRKKY